MINDSLPNKIFIRICISLLHYATPLCIVALAALTLSQGLPTLWSPVGITLIGYSVIDLAFALAVWVPYNVRLKSKASYPPGWIRTERKALLEKTLAHIPDPEKYLDLWFLGSAKPEEIRRDNVVDFLLWAFFDCEPGETSPEDEEELDEYVGLVETRLGRKFEPGRGSVKSLRLTIDAVETRYRTWLWYMIIILVDLFTHVQLELAGLKYHAQAGATAFSVFPPRFQNFWTTRRSPSRELSYWYRPHKAPDKKPVIFLHGIGVGLLTYIPLFSGLIGRDIDEDGVGIIALELLPVSFRFTSAPLEKLEFLEEIGRLLDVHGWDEITLVCHSYGSALTTHMLKSETLGHRIPSVMLIDPVTIYLHLPDVAYNFTRRKPRRANEWQLWYFASMDPGVAYALGRKFHWKENIVWKEELLSMHPNQLIDDSISGGSRKRRVVICLAEKDLIVPTAEVVRYIAEDENQARLLVRDARPGSGGVVNTKDGIELYWFPGVDHAQVFDSRPGMDRVCGVIHRLCA